MANGSNTALSRKMAESSSNNAAEDGGGPLVDVLLVAKPLIISLGIWRGNGSYHVAEIWSLLVAKEEKWWFRSRGFTKEKKGEGRELQMTKLLCVLDAGVRYSWYVEPWFIQIPRRGKVGFALISR